MGTAVASGANRAIDAATRAINSPLLEDNSIQGAQGILINVCGSSSLTLSEVHEASSVIEKAAHENANIIFGAVLDENMKEQVKITVIAAGFREAARRQPHQKPSFLPKTWKAAREEEPVVVPQEIPQEAPRPVVNETIHQENTSAADDLDVPTFLRRAAQKA
jgi:cell division protein FtsZ